MKRIGILGTGRMGVRLARMFGEAGVEVLLGSRDRERASRIAEALKNEKIKAATYSEALESPVVLPSIFVRDGLFDMLSLWRGELEYKIVVDITNPFNHDYTDFILPWDTSSAEHIQRKLPKSRVVGAFKNVWWEVFDKPAFDGSLSDVYVVSDYREAKDAFLDLTEGTPFRYIDSGRLSNARTIERMTLLSGELGQRLGFFPRMNYKLLGEEWTPGRADRGLGELIAVK